MVVCLNRSGVLNFPTSLSTGCMRAHVQHLRDHNSVSTNINAFLMLHRDFYDTEDLLRMSQWRQSHLLPSNMSCLIELEAIRAVDYRNPCQGEVRLGSSAE
ncbi:hypothetical protein HBI70_237780 [Parastagonospora nodorum]|nr:hypothetical protein HBH51_234620 [Parastagonospora nodorum]KAH4112315.1 hypothetical protein HBH47_227860 [Parastagonospora nodorum]KAH4250743.1 hypothetical protein HBI03_236450 [Parastagonospora nodorum]KAH4254853.1 hypothetical protein HBI04_236290 [Parastagonospora nodorum]KAH4595233.1 hypothetical protein HBH82_236030 [Parastagonospora nodorum]